MRCKSYMCLICTIIWPVYGSYYVSTVNSYNPHIGDLQGTYIYMFCKLLYSFPVQLIICTPFSLSFMCIDVSIIGDYSSNSFTVYSTLNKYFYRLLEKFLVNQEVQFTVNIFLVNVFVFRVSHLLLFTALS